MPEYTGSHAYLKGTEEAYPGESGDRGVLQRDVDAWNGIAHSQQGQYLFWLIGRTTTDDQPPQRIEDSQGFSVQADTTDNQ